MVLLLRHYGYLVSALMLLAVFLLAIIACPKQRVGMLLSACLGAPSALFAFFFVPDYWKPVLVVPLPLGLEDIIFSFSVGGIVWLLAVWPLGERLRLRLQTKLLCARLLACALPFFLVISALWRGGLPIMTSVLLTMAALAIVLLWLRPRFLTLSLMGMLGFSFYHTLNINFGMWVWPQAWHWNVAKFWGYSVFRISPEETLWAAAYGFVWPLVMAYVFDAELVRVPGALAVTVPEASRGK
jgi:hypothetical protein